MQNEITENNILLNQKINSPSKRACPEQSGGAGGVHQNHSQFAKFYYYLVHKEKSENGEWNKRREEDAKLYSHLFRYSHPDTYHLL
jgi:hypothetical protein